MAPFTVNEVDQHALDWQILRDGGVCLYYKPEPLAADLDWFRSRRYVVKEFYSSSWHSETVMHDELSSILGFPDYYGRNLNALDEVMSEDLDVPDVGGMVLVLRRFDEFASRGRVAHDVLDTLTRASRGQMLLGKRLLVLLQSDDPRVSFEGLGVISAHWNRKEWLLSNRGL